MSCWPRRTVPSVGVSCEPTVNIVASSVEIGSFFVGSSLRCVRTKLETGWRTPFMKTKRVSLSEMIVLSGGP